MLVLSQELGQIPIMGDGKSDRQNLILDKALGVNNNIYIYEYSYSSSLSCRGSLSLFSKTGKFSKLVFKAESVKDCSRIETHSQNGPRSY